MRLGDTFVLEFEAAFDALTDGYDPEEIAGLGVHSDTDASGLVFATHSRRGQEELLARYPDYPSDAIWGIGDWDTHLPSEQNDSGPQGRVNDAIGRAADGASGDIQTHRRVVWESAVDAMATLHRRGFFERWPEAVRVFMVMDGNLDGHVVYEWHTRFNRAEMLSTLPIFLELDDGV